MQNKQAVILDIIFILSSSSWSQTVFGFLKIIAWVSSLKS